MAWENVYAQQGAFFPSIAAGYNASRQKVPGQLGSPTASGAYTYSLHTAQVTVAYTPDVFGGTRRQVESLKAQADSQRFQLEAAYLTLTSNVVAAAIQEAGLRGQIAATRRIIDIESHSLELLKRQYALGQVARADVVAQEAALAQCQATLPPLEKQLAQQRDLLSRLAGRFPSEALTDKFEISSLELPQELPVSLPSKLVEQRPDVRSAEEQMHCCQRPDRRGRRQPAAQHYAERRLWEQRHRDRSIVHSGDRFLDPGGQCDPADIPGGDAAAPATCRRSGLSTRRRRSIAAPCSPLSRTWPMCSTPSKATPRPSRRPSPPSKPPPKVWPSRAASWNWEISATWRCSMPSRPISRRRSTWRRPLSNRYADTAALFQALGGGWWNRSDVPAAERGESIRQNAPCTTGWKRHGAKNLCTDKRLLSHNLTDAHYTAV